MKASLGFSVSELLVCLAVVGVVASFSSLPLVDVFPSIRVEQSIRALGALMEWARLKAVMEGCAYVVVFSAHEGRVEVFRDEDGDGPEPQERVRALDLGREYPGTVFGACPGTARTGSCQSVDPEGIHFLSRRVAFLPSGTTDRCGSVYLVPQKDLAPGRKDRMRALSVILATGRVQLWRYDPEKAGACGDRGAWEPL